MSKPRKDIRWSEMPQFMPMNKSFYEKLKSYTLPVVETPSPEALKMPGLVPNRQRLLHLIKCLAISETQRKQLSSHLEEITRQKLELDTQLQQKEKEKNEILTNEKNAKSILEKTCSTLEEKEKEIDLLQKKLSELQRKADPKIPNIPDHSVVHPLGQINAPQQAAVVNTPPVAIEQPTIASPVQALEEKLAIIQNEISNLTAKITLVASQTPKEVIREIIREPAVIPTQSRHHSLAHAISISNDDSSLSSGQLKSIEEIPNLAALLKKILKSRKVHYSESAPKQAEAELNEKKKVKEANVRSGSISKHIERLEAELYEKKRLLKKEVKAELGHLENRRAESRNVATSPPNETFVYQSSKFEEKKPTAIESTHRQNLYEEPQHVRASQTYLNERDLFNSRDSYLRRENYVEISEQDPPRPTYSYRKERGNASDHVKPRKSKSRSKSDYSICECSTCSENVSWVCPGCVSEESSIRQPRTNYFDDDTSMIRPLAEIVSDLENERTMMPSFAVVDRYSHADGELLEVISSLNGL